MRHPASFVSLLRVAHAQKWSASWQTLTTNVGSFLNIFYFCLTFKLTEQCLSSAWTQTNGEMSPSQLPQQHVSKCCAWQGAKIGAYTMVLCFHYSRLELEPINTCDFWGVTQQRTENRLYTFALKTKAKSQWVSIVFSASVKGVTQNCHLLANTRYSLTLCSLSKSFKTHGALYSALLLLRYIELKQVILICQFIFQTLQRKWRVKLMRLHSSSRR